MVFYITFLRALAACFITNAHYEGIYPTDIIANGGLLGDVLFFAVSGFCLYNINKSFFRWYGKRLYRVYLPVAIITLIYLLFGLYSLNYNNIFWWFVYPTNYHFIASIIILYIPFYFIIKYLDKYILHIIAIILAMYLFVYLFIYDKSYYHIDTVREPMIWFLYIESMLLGAWFRKKDKKFKNKFSIINPLMSVFMFICYFGSKLIFTRYSAFSVFQIINQIILFVLLYFVLKTFSSLDYKLMKLPTSLKKIIEYIAKLTLEIYLVQYVLIDILRNFSFFPINWIVVTGSIIISAFILHVLCDVIYKGIDFSIHKISKHKDVAVK